MKLYDYEKEHIKKLRKLIAECCVLLKKNGDFPLEAPGTLALFGSGARHTLKGGTGSGEVNSHYFVTIEKGFKNAGFEITSTKWLDEYDKVLEEAKKKFYRGIRNEARKKHANVFFYGMGKVMPEPEYEFDLDYPADTCVYVLSRICGEGNDRQNIKGDILLSDTEIRDIKLLHEKYARFMLVLNVGGPVDLSQIPEVENILLLSQLGVDTGNILAALILGKAYPSGKLTTTWASIEAHGDDLVFGDEIDTRYTDGIYVGYRYFDSVGKKPAFPFGFGLCYTEFSISTNRPRLSGTTVSVPVTVKNTGSFKGMEVIQVYVSSPEGKLDKPYQVLAAFAKTPELKPGASKKFELSFDMTDLASYDASTASYILEKGLYTIRVGNSSADTQIAGCISLDKTAVTKQVKNIFGEVDFEDFVPEKRSLEQMSEATLSFRNIRLKAASVTTKVVDYDCEHIYLREAEEYSNEQLAALNVGAYTEGLDLASVVGSAGKNVAGSAGESSSVLKDHDVPPIIMADGPAGLRLAKNYISENGLQRNADSPLPAESKYLMTGPEKIALKLAIGSIPKNAEILHHYATAIPIGTAIAQSFNTELATACGDIVGGEMEMYGVHLWLAPALNIHRDIRCGRNFEYFSEDPLVSGLFAAAITNGVQKHRGCGVTIKHFAANNQEYNRYNNNSMVSERALREIYLKGFEIAIRQSSPKTIMTSYNLINGIHTSQHPGLIKDVLRGEFEFEGVVMTDWIVGGGLMGKNPHYPAPDARSAAKAGNDLFMPGSKENYEDVLSGLKDNSIDRIELMESASRVINLARELNYPSDKE